MAKHIAVTLLHTPCVLADGRPVVFPYRKAEGFFYYLCMEKRITRAAAIGIFWADQAEANARKSVRDALYHIRRLFGDDVVLSDGNTFLYLNPDSRIETDVDRASDDIVENYTGEFLKSFYIKDCYEFESWAQTHRQALLNTYVRKAEARAREAMRKGEVREALHCAERLLAASCIDEGFYREVISFLMGAEEYSPAISLYKTLAALLQRELDETPEAETQALFERLLSLRRTSRKSRPAQEVFIGRQNELSAILDTVRKEPDAVRDNCRFVLIEGEAGIGKTVLLERLHRLLPAREYITFFYACCQPEADLYLKLWDDLSRQLQLFSEKETGKALISDRAYPEDNIDFRLFATQYGNYMEKLLRDFARSHEGRRIVFLLDDIQWMDSAAVSLLNHLLLRTADLPVFVIAAKRPDFIREIEVLKTSMLHNSAMRFFDLQRFSFAETKELIRKTCPALLTDDGRCRRIYDYSEGNPLFLTELIKLLKENRNVPFDRAPMSSRIAGAIAGRLLRFSEEEMRLLEIMSVFYRRMSVEQIRLLYPVPEAQLYLMLEELLKHQLIVEQTRDNGIFYRFSHILIQNYICARISAGRKKDYYRRIAGALERQYEETGDPDLMSQIIYYFEQAQDTFKYYSYKLEYYKSFFSNKQEIYPILSADAGEHLLDLDAEPDENMLVPLAEKIRMLPQRERRYQELRMKMEYLIGRYDLSSGDYKKGLRNMNTCISNARRLKNRLYLMDSYKQMIYYAIQIYDLDMMQKYIADCEALLEQYEFSEYEIYSVRRLRALHYMKTGRLEDAVALLLPLTERLEALRDVDFSYDSSLIACYNYLGEIAMERHAWEDAQDYVGRAISCSRMTRKMAGAAVAYTNMGIILYQLGHYGQATDYFREARDRFRHITIQWGQAREEAYSAFLDLKTGNQKAALEHYNAACKYSTKDYSPQTASMLQEMHLRLKKGGIKAAAPPRIP